MMHATPPASPRHYRTSSKLAANASEQAWNKLVANRLELPPVMTVSNGLPPPSATSGLESGGLGGAAELVGCGGAGKAPGGCPRDGSSVGISVARLGVLDGRAVEEATGVRVILDGRAVSEVLVLVDRVEEEALVVLVLLEVVNVVPGEGHNRFTRLPISA